ncbi:MAG TPA: hypothetical protein VES19_07655 [Candidatus Limnocylindrales bacterium]|nr:hypothetical protein [Candidatus Limnocylindrales bacterium]
MARLAGLLKRTSKAEELELELARQGSIARLERLLAQRAGIAMDDDSVEDEIALDDEMTADAAVLAPDPGAVGDAPGRPEGREGPDAVPAEDLTFGVPVMEPTAVDATRRLAVRHRPSAVVVEDDWDHGSELLEPGGIADDAAGGTAEPASAEPQARTGDATTDVAAPIAAGEPAATTLAQEPAAAAAVGRVDGEAQPAPARRAPARSPRRRAAAPVEGAPVAAATAGRRRVVPPPPPRVGARAIPIHPKRPKRRPRLLAVLAACPSCAVLLDPRPTASKRCARCRERIVVKRVEGGVLYLTAAAATALEEAQRAVKVWARLARARDRWLTQAAGVGAPTQRLARVARPMPSEEQVTAARDLYFATADRAFAAARREARYGDAAAIRRAHAQALLRELGASESAPEPVLALYRDAMTAELRAQREHGRDAELLAARCCDACMADAGRIVRISDELKAARLPHAACPQGICKCRWAPSRVSGRRPSPRAATR